MMIVLVLLLVACGPSSKQKVEIGMLTYGFVQSEEDGSIDFDNMSYLVNFHVGEIYYMVINFSIATVEGSDTTNEITFKIRFENVDKLSGTIEDANTGHATEMTVRDSEGNNSKEAMVTFSVPREAGKTAEKRVIIKLIPETLDDTAISAVFKGENVELLGEVDGFTKNFSSTKVQIEAPQLSVDAMGVVRWYHVEHADYYKLVVDGVVIEHIIEADNIMAGTERTFALSEYGLTQGESIQIVAFSNSTNYLQSNPSNAVSVNL
jgi:hypothetical protein